MFSRIEVAGVLVPGLRESEPLADTVLIRRFATEANSNRFLARSGKTVSFGREVVNHYSSLPVSVINCHSVASLPACIALKRSTGARLVYDTHELETEASAAVGVRRPVYKAIERLGLKFVDHTFTVSESIEDWYRRTYGLTRIDTIYNYPSQEQANSEDNRDYFRRRYGTPDTATIYLYQGVLGEGRGIEAVVEAFRTSLVSDGLLVLLGYGPLEDRARDWARECERIVYHPAVSPREVAALTGAADVGLVPTPGSRCLSYYYSAPNKMFQYWRAGIPVIATDLPEHRRFLDRYHAGVLTESSSPGSFAAACRDLQGQDPDRISEGLSRANVDLRWESYDDLFRARYEKLTESIDKEK
jgi:glycosyltransferase involved in cell wall biosynthesis